MLRRNWPQGADLLVVDMEMPGRASWVAWVETRRLRPGLPIILTGAQELIAAGVPDEILLPKPFKSDALAGAIADRLGVGCAQPT